MHDVGVYYVVMALKKTTLAYNAQKSEWQLRENKTHRLIESWDTKDDATARGELKDALGKNGGSVRIEYKEKSGFAEERTFPKSADPKKSKG